MTDNMVLADSEALLAVAYDGSTLTVEFRNGGTHSHHGVPHPLYEDLMQAPSKGAFYNEFVRGKYH